MGNRQGKPKRVTNPERAPETAPAASASPAVAAPRDVPPAAADRDEDEDGPPPPPWRDSAAPAPVDIDDAAAWLREQLVDSALARDYPELAERCCDVAGRWYETMPKSVWGRVTKSGRLVKELNESGPVISRTMAYVDAMAEPVSRDEKLVIVDLCSGFGYLAMFLSELLNKDKVEEIVLVDKMWAMWGMQPKPHHISWTHIHGEGDFKYPWPITLSTRKVDLKDHASTKQMTNHLFARWKGPFVVLGIHLCGILSIKAVEMFNRHPNVKHLILKPCCLPDFTWTFRSEYFEVGSHKHRIPTKEVCSRGKWKKNKWVGPPRSTLKVKFEAWNDHLCKSIDDERGNIAKNIEEIKVQTSHFQNLFIFGQRERTRMCVAEESTGVVFPTPTGVEAGRWCPTGTGYGTHVKANE